MSLGKTFDDSKIAIDIPPEPDPPATPLFAHMAKKKDIHPGDIHRVLSQSMAKGAAPPARKLVVQDGVTYYAVNQHIQYWASSHGQVRLMCKALTTIKLLIFPLLQLEPS
jgi:hypothetical protein